MSRQTIALEAKITELQQELRKHNELIVRFVETDRSSSSKKEKASKKSNKTETTREDYHRQTERVVEPPRRVCYVYRTKSAQRTSLQFEREIETQLNDLLSSHVKPSGGLFSSFWSPGQPKTDYWTVQPFQGGRRVPSRSPVVVLTFAEGVRVDEEELNHAFAELSASDCVPLLIATLRYGDRSQPALLPEGWRKPGGRELLCLNFAFGRTGLVDHLTKESIVQLATLLNSD